MLHVDQVKTVFSDEQQESKTCHAPEGTRKRRNNQTVCFGLGMMKSAGKHGNVMANFQQFVHNVARIIAYSARKVIGRKVRTDDTDAQLLCGHLLVPVFLNTTTMFLMK